MSDIELSVQELSDRTGRTIQSIYKRIKNKNDVIQSFLKKDSEGNIIEPLRIFESAIDVIYNKSATASKLNSKPSLVQFRETEEQTAYVKAIDALQEELRALQEQLRAEREDKQKKDDLIFQLNERLAESQRNLDQQQRLQLLDRQKIQQLEERNARPLLQKICDVFKKKGGEGQ